jgi:hypothetical protein
LGGDRRGCGFARRVETGAAGATGYPHEAAIVHLVQQLRAGVGRAAEPIPYFPMLELCVDLVRVHDASFAHKRKYGGGLFLTRF